MSELGYECCICGKICTDWGNNPWPVNTSEDARCCDDCNANIVVPARMRQMFGRKEDY